MFNIKLSLWAHPHVELLMEDYIQVCRKNQLDFMFIVLFDFSWMKLNVISHKSAHLFLGVNDFDNLNSNFFLALLAC